MHATTAATPVRLLDLGAKESGAGAIFARGGGLFSTENGTFPNTPPPKKAFNCWASVLSLFIYVFRIIRAWRVQQKGSRLSVPKAGTLMLSDTGHPGFGGVCWEPREDRKYMWAACSHVPP